MKNLDELRLEIDKVDRELLKLFTQRMDICSQVADYKRSVGMPILDAEREKRVLDSKMELLDSDELKGEVYDFFDSMMAISRGLQAKRLRERDENDIISQMIKKSQAKVENPTVCYFGAEGSYSEIATIKYFGEDVKRYCKDTFLNALNQLSNDDVDYAVVPLENSSTGAISQVMDLLAKMGYFIVGEVYIPIHHCLLGKKGTKITDIKKIYSHEQGLLQSADFISGLNGVECERCQSTAQSAKLVAESDNMNIAAIAGCQNAKLYDLEILAENINSSSVNTTRFVVVSKKPEIDDRCDKVSIVCSLPHESGALYRLLACFARAGVSLLKLESRPVPDKRFEYMFFMDYEGNLRDQDVCDVTRAVMEATSEFKLLGNYSAGNMEE